MAGDYEKQEVSAVSKIHKLTSFGRTFVGFNITSPNIAHVEPVREKNPFEDVSCLSFKLIVIKKSFTAGCNFLN